MKIEQPTSNRVLVVDDDVLLIREYLRCLGEDFEPDAATQTLGDLEKVLFGDETDEKGTVKFEVHTRNQGDAAIKAVEDAVSAGQPFAIAFIDIRMPPGIDGIEAAKRIRAIDEHVNIVIVTGSLSLEPENLASEIPPADKVFFFKKPFHAVECRQLTAALCGKWHADLALRKANEALEQRVRDRTAELHRLAYYDPVTELPNRLKLIDELQVLIDRATDPDEDTAVILFDIDRFSFLNETIGYDSGTDLLRSVAARLEEGVDNLDCHHSALAGRFGADEFACLVPGLSGSEQIGEIVEEVRSWIEAPFLINEREIYLKLSIGVAWHPSHGRDAPSVFRSAEAALHRSMRRPERGVTFYSSEMQYRAKHRFNMESELRQAIENGEVVTHFQPQLSLKTGGLAGIEALARWHRPDGSVVAPAEFIPLCEEMGISDSLFESIMHYVCDVVSDWRQTRSWDVPVSVNLSAQQLRNENLVGIIKRILQSKNLDQNQINLELTETVLLEDLTLARPALHDLSTYGVGIHIDDFGTGYSSLSYLAELPVQALKIDRSFVERLLESPTNARVVQAIIGLGKAMNLGVVAEGVETQQQLMFLDRFGCDLVQGFFIARPMPAADFCKWADTLAEETGRLRTLSDDLPRKTAG